MVLFASSFSAGWMVTFAYIQFFEEEAEHTLLSTDRSVLQLLTSALGVVIGTPPASRAIYLYYELAAQHVRMH